LHGPVTLPRLAFLLPCPTGSRASHGFLSEPSPPSPARLASWSTASRADSHLSGLTDPDGISGTTITNINGDGHTVYYDEADPANAALAGLT
jgi:hypothetical protein